MKDLKTLRVDKGYSQERLAELAGTSQPHIGRLEKQPDEPDYRPMTIRMAQKLAPLLGCKAKDLLPISDDAEDLPQKPGKINPDERKRAYPSGVKPQQEGKQVLPDHVLTAIGRLTIELESVKAELREIKGEPRTETNPRKARGK